MFWVPPSLPGRRASSPPLFSGKEDLAEHGGVGSRASARSTVADTQRKAPICQAGRLPITKCRIREITANTSNKWIRPPATWNTVKPPIHAISSTTNKIVQMLIGFSSLDQSENRPCIPVKVELGNLSRWNTCFVATGFSGRRYPERLFRLSEFPGERANSSICRNFIVLDPLCSADKCRRPSNCLRSPLPSLPRLPPPNLPCLCTSCLCGKPHLLANNWASVIVIDCGPFEQSGKTCIQTRPTL